MKTIWFAAVCLGMLHVSGIAGSALGQTMPANYQEVLTILGKKGDFKEHVLKINIPRNDLKVTVAGVQTPTSFGFGGWLAMTKGEGGKDVMMGDLVLLQDEVNPVMSELLNHGLQVTALHNHFFWEEPRVFYMHVHGYGEPVTLANSVKPAIDLIGQGSPHASAQQAAGEAAQVVEDKLDTGTLEKEIGLKAERMGPVVKFTIGRDDLQLREMGALINSRMGLNTWAAFVGSDANAAVAGDIAMLESEVNSVLKALRQNHLNVVAIHQHMFGTQPEIIFLHYWGTGPAAQLAAGFKAAVNQLGHGGEHHMPVAAHPDTVSP